MSDGAAQNGATQAASTGEASAVASPAVTATAAAAAPAVAQPAATPSVNVPPAAAAPAAVAVPAAVSVAVAAPAAAADADCKPVKKKAHHDDAKKDGDEEHARAPGNDEDQNLSQPADGCVLPQNGAAPAAEAPAGPPVEEYREGGGGSGLLIGAGVLAAVGVGVLALAGGDKKDDNLPPVANADTGAVNEGSTLTGSVATNDSDPNNDALTYTISGTAPAGLTLNSNGSYTFDANNGAYNALVAGATQVVTANYTVSDGRGGTANSTLTITVTGTNDVPVAVADTAAATEGGAVVTGNVAANDTDPDTGQTATLTYTISGTAPAGLTLNSNGTFSFDPTNAAYNSLAAGQTQAVVATITARDASGGTSNSTLTITVTGTNDAPVASSATIAATEGAAPITGTLTATDPDQGAVLAYSLNAPVAGLTLNQNGSYSFNPNDPAYNSLAAGQTRTVVANFTVTDDKGATSTSTLTINLTGTNDAPVAVAEVNAGVEQAPNLTGSVATNDSDPDTGAVLTYSLNAPVAGLTFNADGSYVFDLNDPAYDSLNTGQTQVVVANYTVTDDKGATSTSTLSITVTGLTDGPVAVVDNAAATEGAVAVTGSIATNDNNSNASGTVTYTLGAPVAGLTLNADGTFSFDPANAAYNSLAAGQTQTVVANTIATDALGRTSNSTLNIVVTGTNDAPVATSATIAATEGAAPVTGTLTATDPDQNAVLTYTLDAPVAGLTLSSNGSYSFDPNNPAYNSLAAGQALAVVANFTVTDDNGATSTSSLTINVTGTNDAPVAVADNNSGLEDTVISGTVATNDSDPDQGAALTYTIVGTAPAGFTLNADGSYALDANNAAYQGLNDGQVQNVVVNYQVSDGTATATSTLTIAVNGVTDPGAPPPATSVSLDVDDNSNPNDARTFNAGTGAFIFTDDADLGNRAIIIGLGPDDRIVLEAGFTYSFTAGDRDGDLQPNDLTITLNNTATGAFTEIILKDAVVNNNLVFDEASAERALGNIDYFSFA